eukprot:scaffold212448_cov31-Tisochrysis_lutea.AAC.4
MRLTILCHLRSVPQVSCRRRCSSGRGCRIDAVAARRTRTTLVVRDRQRSRRRVQMKSDDPHRVHWRTASSREHVGDLDGARATWARSFSVGGQGQLGCCRI